MGKKTLIGITLLAVLIFGVTFLFFGHIRTALTLPAYNMGTTMVTTPKPQPTSRPTAVTVRPGQPPVVPNNFLALDTFQRPNQPLWGVASDGLTWQGDANRNNVFSIAAHTGQVTGNGLFNAILGPQNANVNVLFIATVSAFDAGNVNMGAVLRWTNAGNWYKAYIDGANLIVIKSVNGVITQLGKVPFAARGATSYTLRFVAVGSTLAAKVWPTGTMEPAKWMLSVMDNSLPSGQGGIRLLLENGFVIRVSSFMETTANMTV